MLSVFLDSNICFTDPFMEKNIHNRLLIELAEKELITIYISDVVKKEIINNFEKKLAEHYEEIRKNESKITKLLRPLESPPFEWKETVEEYVIKLKDYYEELEDYGYVEFIPFSNDILPELVERSIKRIKPFSERKMEFRDAIIWFSYVDFVKKPRLNSIKPAYFITNNTEDFTLNGEIHPDLQQDSTDFIFYKTPQDFIQNCEEVKELQKTLALVNWVEDEDIANSPCHVLSMIEDHSFQDIFDASWDYVNNFTSKIPTIYDPDAEYLEATDISLNRVSKLDVEVVLDHVIVSGFLDVEVEFDVSKTNYLFFEPGEDEYVKIGSDEVKLRINFTLTVNQEKKIEWLDIVEIEQA
ncbi:PIN domain-containing protein [Sutcliffiella horikoshii]|uniref:PIN domain-containing protein n=1 Tax=Sutcliffiella horikoshii TaxID=79883 RepID=UPI00203A7023|nr:PIN domain-containing protein [Sutcliffiella horikoshii]MCM3619776.1 PIN domain-containing protein [Sutcliffiella horikoshii]